MDPRSQHHFLDFFPIRPEAETVHPLWRLWNNEKCHQGSHHDPPHQAEPVAQQLVLLLRHSLELQVTDILNKDFRPENTFCFVYKLLPIEKVTREPLPELPALLLSLPLGYLHQATPATPLSWRQNSNQLSPLIKNLQLGT